MTKPPQVAGEGDHAESVARVGSPPGVWGGGGLDVQSGQVPKEVKDKGLAAGRETGASAVWVRNERLGAPWPWLEDTHWHGAGKS